MTDTVVHIPTLETERLRLRAPKIEDFDAYARFRAGPRVALLGGPFTRTQSWGQLAEISGQWVLRGYGRWIVALKDSDTPVGIVGLYHPEEWPEAEIAWSVFDEGEGHGYAHEAALAARTYAYERLGWTRLISMIAPSNTRSIALAKRMGATREDVFHHETLGSMDIWRHQSPAEVDA